VNLARLLAAWSWLRWRALVNALAGKRRSGAGRVSAWLSLVLTIVLSIVALGWAVGLSIGAWIAGRSIAGGNADGPGLTGIRVAAAILTVILGSVAVLSGGRTATSDWTRLLLLPIARRHLQAMELLAGLGDPWLVVIAAPLAVLALAMAPRWGAMAIVALGGVLLFVVLGALTTLLSLLVQLLLRDRRRAEVVVLVALIAMMTMGWMPGLLARSARDRRVQERPTGTASAAPSPGGERGRGAIVRRAPPWHPAAVKARRAQIVRWLQPSPSEAYARAVAHAAAGRPTRAALPLAVLAIEVALFCSLSAVTWRQLVESPAVGSRRRRSLALPRLAAPSSPAGHPAMAVARAQVATTLRTVQGRVALVSPLLIVAAVSLTRAFRAGGPFDTIAPFFGATAILAIGPFSLLGYQNVLLNQFGNDGAGFSLQVLSPLSERALVAGRALGGAGLVLLALLPAMVVAAFLHPGTPLLLWPATLFGAAAAYLLFAPAALGLSLLFPKAADLSKLGRKGKPHGGAALGGMLTVGIAFGLVQGFGAIGFLIGRAPGALVAEALLAGAALAIAWPLLVLVAAAMPARRDALLLALRAD
jgi:hypothetical protein